MVWIDRLARRVSRPGDAGLSRWTRRAIASGAFGFIAGVLVCKLALRDSYTWWIREDGPVESATSVAYFLACLLALHLAGEMRRGGHRFEAAIYLVMSGSFFFVAGEEISWGQRLLGFTSPRFMLAHNHQKEANLHNLASAHVLHAAYVVVSGYGVFASFLVPASLRERHPDLVSHFVPDRFLAPCFLLTLLVYVYLEYVSPLAVARFGEEFGWGKHRFVVAKDQEPAELLMSAGFLVFMVVNCLRHARLDPAARAPAVAPRRLVAHPR